MKCLFRPRVNLYYKYFNPITHSCPEHEQTVIALGMVRGIASACVPGVKMPFSHDQSNNFSFKFIIACSSRLAVSSYLAPTYISKMIFSSLLF